MTNVQSFDKKEVREKVLKTSVSWISIEIVFLHAKQKAWLTFIWR